MYPFRYFHFILISQTKYYPLTQTYSRKTHGRVQHSHTPIFVSAAVQVRAVNTVLKVNIFLEFAHLLRNFLSQLLLTCNTDWNTLSVSKAHP